MNEPEDKAGWTRRDILTRGGKLAAAVLALSSACASSTGSCRGVESARRSRTDEPAQSAEEGASEAAADAGRAKDASDARDTSDASDATAYRPDGGVEPDEFASWQAVRDSFEATPELIHMAGMLLATHPKRVRDAIEEHRRGLNEDPVGYLQQHWGRPEEHLEDEGEEWAMRAAGRYLQTPHTNIALTDSTTMGLAMVYNGIDIRSDQEVLTGHWNHWATEGSLKYSAQKKGFDVRRAVLYDDLSEVTKQELVDRLIEEISPKTRVVAVTWVHSVSGLKLPIGEIGRRIEEINQNRSAADRILYCVDGVHGFGVEDAVMDDFHCDFFIAGCHKWLFGPRGTGIIVGTRDGWSHSVPTIPSFSKSITLGRRNTPGGFHSFEHRWALHKAFEFHEAIGKPKVEERIHGLTDHLVEGLADMDHVRLRTPQDPELRAGIVTLQVDGHGTYDVTGHLKHRDIVASTTPEDGRIPRLTPGLLNNHAEVETTLEAVRELA